MANFRPVIPFFILGAIIITILLILKSPEEESQPPIIAIRTAALSSDLPIRNIRIAGTTQSVESAVVRFQLSGRVTKQLVGLGDTVVKGDVLAQLYNPEIEPLTQAAEDNLARLKVEAEQAERNFERVDLLYKERAVTQQEWENTRTKLTSSQKAQLTSASEFERASQVSDELSLVAPFAGSVTEILTDVGEVVSPGSPAIRLSNPNSVELELAVSDVLSAQIIIGQTVTVAKALEPSAKSLQGIVTDISPYRERGSLPEVIISLDADEIGPGIAVNVVIDIKATKGLSIPMRSVLMTGDNTVAVYRVIDGIASLVPVRPLRITNNGVVIEQGLLAGDALVIEGISQLFDGARVAEMDTDAAGESRSEVDSEITLENDIEAGQSEVSE